jgi:DeoR family fructose operon transcriptional repressor
MLPAERRMQIVERVKQHGTIEVAELSKIYQVSEGTIRRDLRILEKKELLERTYGGAIPYEGTAFDPSFVIQKQRFVKEKQAIAKAAADLIEEGDTIFLDSSSTNLFIVDFIKNMNNITIVTNGLEIAYKLMHCSNLNTIVTGGDLRRHTASLVGRLAEYILQEVYVDKAFLGVSAISLQRGMSTGAIVEADLKKTAIASAREIIAVTDSSKFEKDGFAKVSNLDSIDIIVTDNSIPEEFKQSLEELGVEVIIADFTED